MAQNKKGFILYADLIHTVGKLSDEQAGILFKHILSYVNDESPTTEDVLIQIAFEPIKQQLKRDLKHWESIREKRSKAGKISAEKKKQNQHMLTHVNKSQHKATQSTVIVNDNVNVKVNDKVKDNKKNIYVFNFRKELLNLGIEKQIVETWLQIRNKKKAVNSEIALNAIKKQITLSGKSSNECIKIAVENSWSGFKSEWVEDKTNGKFKKPDFDKIDEHLRKIEGK